MSHVEGYRTVGGKSALIPQCLDNNWVILWKRFLRLFLGHGDFRIHMADNIRGEKRTGPKGWVHSIHGRERDLNPAILLGWCLLDTMSQNCCWFCWQLIWFFKSVSFSFERIQSWAQKGVYLLRHISCNWSTYLKAREECPKYLLSQGSTNRHLCGKRTAKMLNLALWTWQFTPCFFFPSALCTVLAFSVLPSYQKWWLICRLRANFAEERWKRISFGAAIWKHARHCISAFFFSFLFFISRIDIAVFYLFFNFLIFLIREKGKHLRVSSMYAILSSLCAYTKKSVGNERWRQAMK